MNFGCFVRRPWLVVIVLATHTLIDYSAVPTYTQIIMKYFLSFSIENKKNLHSFMLPYTEMDRR